MYKISSYDINVLFISVSFPSIAISRKGELKDCSPFIAIYIALSSNTANLHCRSKINLKPVVIAVGGPWAPAISSGTMQAAVIRLVGRTVLRWCCHLIIRNCSRRYTNCFASCSNNWIKTDDKTTSVFLCFISSHVLRRSYKIMYHCKFCHLQNI